MVSDLISRSALLKAMDERYKEIETEKQYPFASDEERGLTAGFCEVDELVNNQPTVDAVEVVHGEWIRKEYNSDYPYYRMECSNCGGRMPRDQITKEYYSDYCQSCGAKMDGGTK